MPRYKLTCNQGDYNDKARNNNEALALKDEHESLYAGKKPEHFVEKTVIYSSSKSLKILKYRKKMAIRYIKFIADS